jgi:competence protein ComGC
MLVRAKVSFAGAFSMYKGEVKECSDTAILQDLIKAGYIEEVKQEKATKGGKDNESKRNNGK